MDRQIFQLKNKIAFSWIIYLLILANFIVRLQCLDYPFWGLEYEDSFVFCESSRMYYEGQPIELTNLTVSTCVDGSIQSCGEAGVYGGHFYMFPAILSLTHLLFGYSPTNVFLLNAVISCLVILIGFRIAKRLSIQYISIGIFALLFLVTPFIPIFNTSGLSETFSSLLVFAYLGSFLLLYRTNFKLRSIYLMLALGLFLLAIITKRENIILIGLISVVPLVQWIVQEKTNYKSFIIILASHVFIGTLIYSYFDIWSIEQNESGDLAAPTFSFRYLYLNGRALLEGFVELKYWGITGLLFVIASLVTLIKIRKVGAIIVFTFLITWGYILIYSLHYRSYYQVMYGDTSPFDSFRYAVNYFPVMAFFIGLLLSNFKSMLKQKTFKLIGIVMVLGTSILLMFDQNTTRRMFSDEEYFVRLQPVVETLRLNSETPIITDIPSIFRCYANPNTRIIDYHAYGDNISSHFTKVDSTNLLNLGNKAFLVINNENSIDDKRYGMNNNDSTFLNYKLRLVRKLELYNIYALSN